MYYALKRLGIEESQNFEQGGGINYKSVHKTNLKLYLQKLTILERRAGNGCGCISILKLIYHLWILTLILWELIHRNIDNHIKKEDSIAQYHLIFEIYINLLDLLLYSVYIIKFKKNLSKYTFSSGLKILYTRFFFHIPCFVSLKIVTLMTD